MSAFTIPLKRVIVATGGTAEIVGGIRKLVGGNIGLADYPIFDDEYRDHLNGTIVDNFWNREIGLETIEMFQLAMRRKMNLIMPFYNKVYESTLLEIDPLSTIKMRSITTNETTQTNTSNSTNVSTSENDSASRSVQSSTPQTMLSGNGDYATGAADVNGKATVAANGTENGEFTGTGEGNSDNTVTGYQGLASDLIMRYRQSLLNVDMMILNDLDDCFIQVWDNGDSYTDNGGYFA